MYNMYRMNSTFVVLFFRSICVYHFLSKLNIFLSYLKTAASVVAKETATVFII